MALIPVLRGHVVQVALIAAAFSFKWDDDRQRDCERDVPSDILEF